MNLLREAFRFRRISKAIILISIVFILFNGVGLLFGYWARFVVSVQVFDTTLNPLESASTEFAVSFDPEFASHQEGESVPYEIATRSPECEQFDDESGECIDTEIEPNLCPYISLVPQNAEATEIGSGANLARGQLSLPDDEGDTWNLSVSSPCFEGECPADYDPEENGEPLAQSLKGETFTCDVFVEATDPPVLIKNFLGDFVYADTFEHSIEVSAVFTGAEPEGCTSDCFSNVLFLPGLESSRLYRQDGSDDQLWEPNANSDVEDLYLTSDGTSINPDIYTRDIIRQTNTPVPTGPAGQNIYESFSEIMGQLVDDFKITAWVPYAYDWRQSVDDIVRNGTQYQNETVFLEDTLESLIDSSKSGKVTIIAHSNGGLLAKAFLKKLQEDKDAGRNSLIDSVDVLILVAVPQIGTAGAVPAILHGYNQKILKGWLMDEIHARELGRNMLSGFGLLPSREYINRVSASPVTFLDTVIPSGVTTDFVQNYGSAINSYSEYESFLLGNEGRVNPDVNQINLPISLSGDLFSKAESLHNDIDAWVPPDTLRVIEVAGWGLDTIASFEYYPVCNNTSLGCDFTLDERPQFTVDGDGTVVVPSAQYMSVDSNVEKYWVDLPRYNRFFNFTVDRKHKDVMEVDSLNNLIESVIENTDVELGDILKNTAPINDSNRLRLSIHSPVTIDAYDVEGNHTGKICPANSDFCYVEENIPNSSYLEFGEGKYINLPEEDFSRVRLQGTGVGTFTYESEKVLPNGTSTTSSFIDIPVTTQTQAEVTINNITHNPELKLDVTGDGVNDFTLTPNADFDPVTYLQIMKVTINSLDLPQAKKKAFDNRVDSIIQAIQKGKINKASLKADKFKGALEKKLSKPDPKKPKPKKLSKTDAQLLLDMLNKLLDNIN